MDWRDFGLASEINVKRKWRDDENMILFSEIGNHFLEIRKALAKLKTHLPDFYLCNPNAAINGSEDDCKRSIIVWRASFDDACKNRELMASFSEEQRKFLLSNLRDNERLTQLLKQKPK